MSNSDNWPIRYWRMPGKSRVPRLGSLSADAADRALARLARQKKDLDLICFSGYRYEQLLKSPPNPGVFELLAEVDVLIDGPYINALNNSVGLRGSSNQRVIHLTRRLKDHAFESQHRHVEVIITEGEIMFIGIPTPAINSAIQITSHAVLERMEGNERL